MVAGMWRVNGELAVSRAFGDLALKRCGMEICSCHAMLEYDTATDLDSEGEEDLSEVPEAPGEAEAAEPSRTGGSVEFYIPPMRTPSWLESGAVIATPTVSLHEVSVDESPFLVLCCDGIFDVMSDQECLETLLVKLDSLLLESQELPLEQRIPLAPLGESVSSEAQTAEDTPLRPSLRIRREECRGDPLLLRSLNGMLKKSARHLIDDALGKGSTDNLSVVLCLI